MACMYVRCARTSKEEIMYCIYRGGYQTRGDAMRYEYIEVECEALKTSLNTIVTA